jgi:uncharacterized protein
LPSPEAARSALPWRETGDGIELAVRLTPRGGRSGIDGLAESGGRQVLKIRVAAPPVEDAANAALVAFLAEALGVPKSAIRLSAGRKARVKTLHIAGPDLPARLAALLD